MMGRIAGHAPAAAAFDRVLRARLLTMLDPDDVARRVVAAIEQGRHHLRMPRRAAPVAAFTHAPRAVVRAVLTGIPAVRRAPDAPVRHRRRRRRPVNRRRTPVRRQIAVATWRPSRDGRIYARMEVDVTAALAYLERVRAESGERVTLTHVVGAALGRALRDVPEIRARVVFGRLRAARGVRRRASPSTSARAPTSRRSRWRASTGSARSRSPGPSTPARPACGAATTPPTGAPRAWCSLVPAWTMRPVMAASSLVSGGLGRGLVGQPGFPLGTAFVSNVGTLGLDEAFLAPLPFARTPVYLAVGAVQDRAVVVDGQVVARPVLVLVATADHRVVDGVHAGRMARVVRELVTHPERLDHPAAQ